MKAEKVQPALRISVKAGGETVKLRLYDAVRFGGPVGLYRVKVGREWMRTDAEKYLFLTPAAALGLAAREAGIEIREQDAPGVRHHDRVRVRVGVDEAGRDRYERGFVTTPPFQGLDGRWRVFALVAGGVMEVMCAELERVGS
jgi:hypothetical protein